MKQHLAITLLATTLLAAPLAAHAQAPRQPGDPSTNAYQGGVGSPYSTRASNMGPGDTRSEIAPRLPSPTASADDTRAMLMSADRALRARQTGAAQEALERAETRQLSRSTDPAFANQPDTAAMARGIADARSALASNDLPRARAIVERLLNP